MKNKVAISSVNMEERANLGIKAGDTVRVWIKIEEKGKTRLQAFEGLVLARKHGNEAGGTFTVRKVSSGVGVEKIFPLYSPSIDKIEIVKRAKVRRAKLYFIRHKVAREVKRLLRRTTMMNVATKGSAELEEERKKAEAEEAARLAEEEKLAAEKKANEEVVEEKAEETQEAESTDESSSEEAVTEEAETTENAEGKEEDKEAEEVKEEDTSEEAKEEVEEEK